MNYPTTERCAFRPAGGVVVVTSVTKKENME